MEKETFLVFAVLFILSELIERTPFFPLWYLFSTFLHELSHFAVGFILGGKPTFPSLIPRRQGSAWILGTVYLRNPHPVLLMPCGLAPLLLILSGYVLLQEVPPSILRDVLIFFLLKSGVPSPEDLKTAFSSGKGLIFWGAVLGLFFFFSSYLQASF